MACTARESDIPCIMRPTVRAMDNMMQFQIARRAAAGNAAPSTVAMPDQARDARRDVLIRALGDIAVHRSDMLGIAHRALDGVRADGNTQTTAILPSLTAAFADGHGNLESRAAGRLCRGSAVEHRTTQC